MIGGTTVDLLDGTTTETTTAKETGRGHSAEREPIQSGSGRLSVEGERTTDISLVEGKLKRTVEDGELAGAEISAGRSHDLF